MCLVVWSVCVSGGVVCVFGFGAWLVCVCVCVCVFFCDFSVIISHSFILNFDAPPNTHDYN